MNIEELKNNNVNFEDYLNEYGENPKFIFEYYLQDVSRILKNYYSYGKYLTNEDKLKLLSKAINDLNYNAINVILSDIDNMYLGDNNFIPLADELFSNLIELDKIGKIDITKITGSIYLYRSNPIYFVKKSPKYIKFFYNLDINTINEILNYLVSINYTFVEDDRYFIDYSILANPKIFVYFLQNCKYDSSIDNYINAKIGELSKEEMMFLYYELINSDKKYFQDKILGILNFDNYDYKTIIKDKDLCLKYDESKKESIFSLLNEISKNGKNANIILIMNRVDMSIINEAIKIVGDKLKIMPLVNQMSERFNEYYEIHDRPYYDVDYIRKSEEKLDLYASMVNDTKDKDGEIKSLSPLEKFIAAYIIASKFAPYKEVEGNEKSYKSRSVYEFINSTTNTKIVCTGYVHLLREILYRMGLAYTMDWSVKTDTNSEYDFSDHTRMMIHLIDSKYDIDGIYMSDPTLDNRDDTLKSFKHMLMSYDEVLTVDRSSGLTNEMLRADKTYLMGSGLNVVNPYELFRKPIPKETLIKAHLAIEHFFDKNMRMVKDGNYDFLEYCEMAEKLGFYEIYQNNKERLFNELEKMSISEINYNYPGLLDEFLHDLLPILSNKLKESGINNEITCKHEDNMILVGYTYQFATEELNNRNLTINDIELLKEVIPLNRINKRTGEARFFIQIDNNKKVFEQYDEIIEKLCELNNTYQSITSNNNENMLK